MEVWVKLGLPLACFNKATSRYPHVLLVCEFRSVSHLFNAS